MAEEEKKAVNNLWSSVTDVMFNVLYSQEDLQKDLKIALNLIQKQQKEIEKKDKIIKRQAIFIANTDIDEDICKYQTGKFCKKEIYEVPLSICVKCVKQYFENKVEGE